MNKPNWFTEGKVIISNATTCGINKDGLIQYVVDPKTGERSTNIVDNKMYDDVNSIKSLKFKKGSVGSVDLNDVKNSNVYVPQYFDNTSLSSIQKKFKDNKDFELKTFRELVESKELLVMNGHGSPSSDQRVGDVPYIKVSDLRAGQVNINPTNLIPKALAQKFWPNKKSNLQEYDLVSPERASKNIGEFCVLMPGQENVVFTKEVIILRSLNTDLFDQFYLMWVMSLSEVRRQWDRIVLMQTNREDVGNRYYEILIPVPKSKEAAEKVSKSFKKYYVGIEKLRTNFLKDIKSSGFDHHLFLES